jgi:hypothetical protein
MQEIALTRAEVEGDAVEILFLPVQFVAANLDAMLWEDNAKLHDIGGIWESIQRYGMIDPGKWDGTLNKGRGGIVYGNGRTRTVVQQLAMLEKSGGDRPRGIPTCKKSGAWCIPIKFGVDQETEAEAKAAAIDHNNLTLTGGSLTAGDISRIWEGEAYLAQLKELEKLQAQPVSMDSEAIKALEKYMAELGQEEQPKQPPEAQEVWNLTVLCSSEDEQMMAADILQSAGFKTK